MTGLRRSRQLDSLSQSIKIHPSSPAFDDLRVISLLELGLSAAHQLAILHFCGIATVPGRYGRLCDCVVDPPWRLTQHRPISFFLANLRR